MICKSGLKILTSATLSALLVACGGSGGHNNASNFSEENETVYIDDGAIQCGFYGLSEEETAQMLINNGIDVIESQCGFLTGMDIAAQCGLGDVNINLHLIDAQNLRDAQALGFESVSVLERSDDTGYAITACSGDL